MSRRPLQLTPEQFKALVGQKTKSVRRRRKMRAVPLEKQIEAEIVKAMIADGWRPFKMEENFSERKKKKTGEPGMPDRLFVRYWNQADPRGPVPYTKTRCYNPTAEVLWWEFKRIEGDRQKANELDPDQVRWQFEERARGALIWTAGEDHPATIAGAARHYLESGLVRNARAIFERLAA